MADNERAASRKQRSAPSAAGEGAKGSTDQERARELPHSGGSDTEREVRAEIAAMQDADRAMAERVHAIAKASAPELDDGEMWPNAYALKGPTPAAEERIAERVGKAAR